MGKTSTNLVADPLSARSSAGDWFEMTGNTAGVTISFAADTSGELPAGRWTQWEFDATAAGGPRRFTVPNITPQPPAPDSSSRHTFRSKTLPAGGRRTSLMGPRGWR
ncbi:hypothetical protein ACNANV_14205 [Curtobacterium flaccumfaciens pv. flaccumfaciens]|uniref:hypothetical protein n=1 Tax=Curtobacterium flaccumfaciens TaxID=2035 RepID=UPI003A4E15A2